MEAYDERARAQYLTGWLRFLKLLGGFWAGIGLFIGQFAMTYGGVTGGFPLLGKAFPAVLLLGMVLVPFSGFYVATVGSWAGGGRDEGRFGRGAFRSLFLADWIAVLWGAFVVIDTQQPSGTGLFVSAVALVTAAWLGAFVVEQLGVGSLRRGLTAGLFIAELPALGLGLYLAAEGTVLPGTLFGVLAGGPAAVQVLLLADFGLIQVDVPSVDEVQGSEEAGSGFEVLDAETR